MEQAESSPSDLHSLYWVPIELKRTEKIKMGHIHLVKSVHTKASHHIMVGDEEQAPN